MKYLIVLCLLGVVMAAPQIRRVRQIAQPRQEDVHPNNFLRTLRDDRSPVIGAIFNFLYETENKIFEEREGTEGSEGQSNMQGTYKWETPEGETIEITYVADENGFRPEGSAIPAMPPHAIEQLRIAEEQRAAGIKFDDKGFRI